MDHTLGIVLRNLTPHSNFIEFRDCRNLMFFKKIGRQIRGAKWHQRRVTPGMPGVTLIICMSRLLRERTCGVGGGGGW